VFFYRDPEEGLDVLSREVYKTKPLEIHYPFDRKGSQKYRYIRSIEFHHISPEKVHGIYKAVNFGLGFTRNLSPIVYRLEAFAEVGKIVISAKHESELAATEAIFNTGDLEGIFKTIKPLKDVQSEELKRVSKNALAEVFPGKIKRSPHDYK